MKSNHGLTIVEMLVTVLLLSIVSAAGYMLFTAGNSAWTVTEAHIRMQENLRTILQRISLELQESGTNAAGTLQITLTDNGGPGGSDILRFAVPVCPCGSAAIDTNGDVQFWGGPLAWGQSACTDTYPLTQSNKVTICHLPPGNPSNPQTLDVNENAVKAHLAHGDWLGACNGCDPLAYTNLFVEYRMNTTGQLLRRVLDGNLAVIAEVVFAESVDDFQAALNGDQSIVTLDVQMTQPSTAGVQVTLTGDLDVLLRNKG